MLLQCEAERQVWHLLMLLEIIIWHRLLHDLQAGVLQAAQSHANLARRALLLEPWTVGLDG